MADALYPGTFDPVHNGHVDITSRASKLFDRLLVGIYDTPPKEVLFSTEQRVDLFEDAVSQLDNVEVVIFSGLAVEFARQNGADFIVRGLRAGFDFEQEFEMALMWRALDPTIDVTCMMSALEFQFVHSSRIKEIAQLGGNINSLVPQRVASALAVKVDQASAH